LGKVNKLIYSTFIGGSGTDYGWAVAVDATGAVYVTGQTTSPDFPKINAFQTQFTANGQYTFVVKLDPTGSKLLYSSPFGGGGEVGWALAVDSAGNAYVAGGTTSSDFPIVGGLSYNFVANFQHGFVSKIAPAGDHLVFSTFLGGSGTISPRAWHWTRAVIPTSREEPPRSIFH
jgi:Beta-propeller repeat